MLGNQKIATRQNLLLALVYMHGYIVICYIGIFELSLQYVHRQNFAASSFTETARICFQTPSTKIGFNCIIPITVVSCAPKRTENLKKIVSSSFFLFKILLLFPFVEKSKYEKEKAHLPPVASSRVDQSSILTRSFRQYDTSIIKKNHSHASAVWYVTPISRHNRSR